MELPREFVALIPILFHRLKAVGDAMHAEHGVTTSMRGVMASLFEGGPQTVPAMAAARPVSRQHIQTIVDALAKQSLVRILPNPAHKRSSLIDLTEGGYELFTRMRKAEGRLLAETLGTFSANDLGAATAVLERFAAQLETIIREHKEINDAA